MTNDLDGIKPGDRVRVTFEGEITHASASGLNIDRDGLFFDSRHVGAGFDKKAINAPTFQIERIETPLQIGDRVTLCAREDDLGIGEIQAIWESVAWVSFKGDLPFNCVLQNLTRVAP